MKKNDLIRRVLVGGGVVAPAPVVSATPPEDVPVVRLGFPVVPPKRNIDLERSITAKKKKKANFTKIFIPPID